MTITFEEAKANVMGIICGPHDKIVFSSELLSANTEIWSETKRIISISENGWVFFVDDAPLNGMWPHSCRYIFIGLSNGEVHVIDGDSPPKFPMRLLEFG
jgi:hypothetical protein